MLNIVDIQDAIFSQLDTDIVQPVIEQAIPDAQTVQRVSGKVRPYVAVQFGDLQTRFSGRTFAGVRNDDYELPVYVQCIAPEPRIARELASLVLDSLLGFASDWTGEVRKRPGGGMFPMLSSNGATEAYMFPVSFGVTVQLADLKNPTV